MLTLTERAGGHQKLVGTDRRLQPRQNFERPWLKWKIVLQEAYGLDLDRGQRNAVRLFNAAVIGIRGMGVDHLEIRGLEELDRGQRPDRESVCLVGQELDRAVEPQPRLRADGDGEPEVEVVVSPVVLGHARMSADRGGSRIERLIVDPSRHQARSVSDGPRLEGRRDLFDDSLALQTLGAFDDLLFRHVDALSDNRKWRGDERYLRLQSGQQLAVPLIDILHIGNPLEHEVKMRRVRR